MLSRCLVQGSDAGGHGAVRGDGFVSLLPEVADALKAIGKADIPLVAARGEGEIIDGRGVAALIALGIGAVVMGRRFGLAERQRSPRATKRM